MPLSCTSFMNVCLLSPLVVVRHEKQNVCPSVYTAFASELPQTGHGVCSINSDSIIETNRQESGMTDTTLYRGGHNILRMLFCFSYLFFDMDFERSYEDLFLDSVL